MFGRQISSGASVDNSDNSELRRMSRQHCRTRRATWPQLKGSRGFLSSAQQNAKQGCYLERRVIPIIAVAIMIAPSLAYGSPACMTQSEARAKFPKATHLYMHGSDHCWNDSAVSPEHSPRHSANPIHVTQPILRFVDEARKAAFLQSASSSPHPPRLMAS